MDENRGSNRARELRLESFAKDKVLKQNLELPLNATEQDTFAVFFCPFWSEVFSVITRAKARSNPAFADFKQSEVYKIKLDENGLLTDFVFHKN